MIRVLTLNIWARHGSYEARRIVLRDGLRALNPDLIALQEVVTTDAYDQAADLLGESYDVFRQAGRSADGVGAAIASRWPTVATHEQRLTATSRVDPSAGWIGSVAAAEVETPVGRLLFVHHKPSWQLGYELERELQAVAAARFVDDIVRGREMHVVLAGDLDARPDAASVRFWRGRQSLGGVSVEYADAWEATHGDEPGHTFTPRNPLVASGEMSRETGRRIDYVFVRSREHGPTLTINTCALAFDQPVDGVWASDHFGVVAELTLA